MTTADPLEDNARNAYEALRQLVFGVSTISGQTLPPWEELPTSVTLAWVAAVKATEDSVAPPPTPAKASW